MADLRYKVVVDDAEARRKIAELLKGTGAKSSFGDTSADAKKTSSSLDDVRAATVRVKEAQEANIKALQQLRTERSKEIGDLNILKQLEQEARVQLAEKKRDTEALTQAQKQSSKELTDSRKAMADYNLELKKAREEERKAEKAVRDSEKARKEAERQQAQQAKQTERNRKALQQESSEYYQLNRALGNVRKESKDVLAEMFKLERQGRKNSAAYEYLRQRSEGLVKQTQYLDRGIKKIDATLGLHQRNVGNYAVAMEQMSPVIMDINRKLALFGTSIDQLAGKPGAIRELGTAFVSMGKGLLTFLVSPIGIAITALGSLFMLFQRNKQVVMDFNNGLRDISKTTGIEGKALRDLGQDIVDLSMKLKVVDATKLTEYAAVAGQLGVRGRANILAFTEALAMLETASDISGEEGGREIARMLTLVDGGVQNVKDFGDEIVNLGNNFAASEKEILANAEAISQNVGIYRIGRQDVLAYATATKSLGVEAEVVGSTFQKTLGTFERSIRSGKGVADILKVVGGSAADLQRRFREDASGVFQDYIRGLNGIHKAGGSVMAQMEANGITDIRQRRVVATLAAGYDTLARAMDTVRDASGAMADEFENGAGKLVNQTRRMGIAWDNFVLSIEDGEGAIGRSVVAIVGFFASIVEGITPVKNATDKLVESVKEQRDEYYKLTERLNPLVNRYNELKDNVFKTKEEQDELRKITQQIASLLPSAVTGWDRYGNAISISTSRVNELTDAQHRLLAEMNKQAIAEVEKDINRQERAVANLRRSIDEFALKGVDTISIGGRAFGDSGYTKRLEDERKGLEEATDAVALSYQRLQEMGGKLNAEQRNLLAYYGLDAAGQGMREYNEYLKNLNNPSVGTTEESEADRLKREKAEQAAARKAERAAEQRRQAMERQRALQMQIDQANEQAHRRTLSRDAQEIASIKEKYTKIREQVRKFQADPRNKGFAVDMGGLGDSEAREVRDARQRQFNDAKLKQYQEDYQNFVMYEQLKRTEGAEVADSLLGSYSDVVDKLAAEYAALTAKSMIGMISPANEAYRKQIEDQLKAHNKRVSDEERSRLVEALKLAETFGQSQLRIQRKYQDALEALGESATDEQKERLKRLYLDDLEALVESSPEFVKAIEDINKSSQMLLPQAFRTGRDTVMRLIDGMESATDEQKSKLRSLFGKWFDQGEREAVSGNLEGVANLVQGFDQLVNMANQFDGSMSSSLKTVGQMVSQVSRMASTLGNVLGDAGKGLSSTGGYGAIIGAVMSVVGSVIQISEDIKRQRYQKQVADREYADEYQMKQLNAVTQALEYQLQIIQDIYGTDRVKAFSKVVAESADSFRDSLKYFEGRDYTTRNINASDSYMRMFEGRFKGKKFQLTGNADYDRIIEALNSGEDVAKYLGVSGKGFGKLVATFNKMVFEGLLNPIEFGFTSVSDVTQEQLAGLHNMVNDASLDEITRNQVQNIIDQYEIWRDALNQMREELTGVSFKSLTDGIVNMFEQGKTSVEDFTDFFEKQMQQAILRGFSRDAIEKQMQPWYELFAKYSEDGLTQSEIEKLRNDYMAIMQDAQKSWEDLKNVTGIDFSENESSSSLRSEGIARATEEQFSEYLGINRAIFDINKQNLATAQAQTGIQNNLLAVANNKLIALNAIQVNTFNIAQESLRIAENTASAVVELKAINRNTSQQSTRAYTG